MITLLLTVGEGLRAQALSVTQNVFGLVVRGRELARAKYHAQCAPPESLNPQYPLPLLASELVVQCHL
jgi:hypothetical protein